jgi:recombination protein RecR
VRAIDEAAELLSRLPGLGRKSAVRIAYHILKSDESFARALAERIVRLKASIKACSVCGCYSEGDPCEVCSDPGRDRGLICVVEQAQDAASIEQAKEYAGLYHVLGGVIAPLDGVGPEKLRVRELLARLEGVRELIIATNPTVEGDTTALWLQRLIKDTGIVVSRLASGLPVGGDLEYADRLTLSRSFRGRTRVG